MHRFAAPRITVAALTLTAAAILPAGATIPTAERDALVALYDSMQGGAWTTSTGWPTGDPCVDSWYGITCSGGPDVHHVTEMHLSDNNLVGTLPDLSALTALEKVNLSDNQISGPLPNLPAWPALNAFWANNNQFTGFLPDLSALDVLEVFYVMNNQLIGPIPDISELTALRDFRVSTNRLTGAPPQPPANLADGGSSLCPNYLQPPSPDDARWSQATGEANWYTYCEPGFLVTASSGAGGSVSPLPGMAVKADQVAAFTITADAGYTIDPVTSSCGGTLKDGMFTTGPVKADCTVAVTFNKIPPAKPVLTPVPTIGEWALILLAALTAALGLRRLRR